MNKEIRNFLIQYGWAILSAVVVITILFFYFAYAVGLPLAQTDVCVNSCKEKNMSYADLETTNEGEYICYCKNETIIILGKINKEGKIENYTQ